VKNQLKQLLSIVKTLPMDEQMVQLALHSKFKDFEDALQYYAARKSAKIDAIVTRNLKDFKKASLPIFSPSEMLQRVRLEL
jgi:predicted nucleic acid-binding protein